jgi:hypothetical protein
MPTAPGIETAGAAIIQSGGSKIEDAPVGTVEDNYIQ